MIDVLYSFGMAADGARLFEQALLAHRSPLIRFSPFNHRARLGKMYFDAYRLDVDYRARNAALLALYRETEQRLRETKAEILAVDNDNVYHPEFLRSLPCYKVLVSTDDPTSSYARTVPYVRAFDHVLHVTPLYNERVGLREFLFECGARRVDWKPMGVDPFYYDAALDEEALFSLPRDIDVVFVGGYYVQKAEAFRRLFHALGKRLVVRGFWSWRSHVKYVRDTRSFTFVRRIDFADLPVLYRRAKIGINLHTDEYSLGNMRLYQLPANGVLQISDCASDMDKILTPGEEVATYRTIDECIELIHHYLAHPRERERIARAGFRRVMRDYTFAEIWNRLAPRLEAGMREGGHRKGSGAGSPGENPAARA